MDSSEKKRKFGSKLNDALNFVKILRIEPFMFLLSFQSALKSIPEAQLIQDKICRFWYNQTDDFCRKLPKMNDENEILIRLKSQILSDCAQFEMYHKLLQIVPTLLWALLMGSWLDRYLKGRKIVMLLTATIGMSHALIMVFMSIKFNLNVYYIFIAYIPGIIGGGALAASIAIMSYVTMTTPPNLRAIRFTIIELCSSIGSSIGLAIGGKILNIKPIFNSGEILNYSECFIIAIASDITAFIWTLFMINEIPEHNIIAETIKPEINQNQNKSLNETSHTEESECQNKIKKQNAIQKLFDINNIKDIYKCCTKRRPNKVRTQIFVIFLSAMAMVFVNQGSNAIMYQFAQKVYNWNSEWYSYIDSFSKLIHTFTTLIIIPIIIKVFNVADVPLIIIGNCCKFIQIVTIGTVLLPVGYYVSIPFVSFERLLAVGLRSYVSKIVEKNEVGKIFSCLFALDNFMPMASSPFFAFMLRYTMDSYPGMVFLSAAAILFIPILIYIWIDVCTKRPEENDNVVAQVKSEKYTDETHL